MANEPQPTPFAVRMKQERERQKLPKSRVAAKAGVSEARYRQIEQGYEARGRGADAVKFPAEPSPDFIVKVASALGIPRSEALALNGHPVDAVPDEPVDVPPQRLWDNWAKLSHSQKECLVWLSTLMRDPDAAFQGTRATSHSQTPLFVAAETERIHSH